MKKIKSNLLQIPALQPIQVKEPPLNVRPRGQDRKFVTTTIRFPPLVMIRLKKVAIDQGVSLQEMVECALTQYLEQLGLPTDQLRAST